MIGPRRLRRQQKEDKIDRLLVHRVEIDRRIDAHEQTVKARQARQSAMGNGNPIAHPRGAQALALQQNVENLPLAAAGKLRRALGQFLEQLLLAAHPQPRDDGCRRDQINDIHDVPRP